MLFGPVCSRRHPVARLTLVPGLLRGLRSQHVEKESAL
jgi:hypothetical protein